MAIQAQYDTLEDVPENVKELFTEKEGKMVLTGIEGIKPLSEFNKVYESLEKERNDHKQTRDSLKGELETVKSKNEILETQKTGSQTTEEIQAIIDMKVKNATEELTAKAQLLEDENSGYKTKEVSYKKNETLESLLKDKVDADFLPTVKKLLLSDLESQVDGRFMTGKNSEFGEGLDAETLVSKFVEAQPHFAPKNSGGGATGNSGVKGAMVNPFSSKSLNMTEQHKLRLENPAMAETLQAQALKE